MALTFLPPAGSLCPAGRGCCHSLSSSIVVSPAAMHHMGNNPCISSPDITMASSMQQRCGHAKAL